MRAVVIWWLQNQTLIYQITQLLYDDSSAYLLFTSWIWEHAHWLEFRINIRKATHNIHTDRKNATNFLYLVLHLARKVTFYFLLFSSVLVSVLRTSINVLSKSKYKNYVTWIANLTKLFLSVYVWLVFKKGFLIKSRLWWPVYGSHLEEWKTLTL